MNANELAKELSEFMTEDEYTDLDKTIFKAAAMLRQLQAENEALKKTVDSLFAGLDSSLALNKAQAERNNKPVAWFEQDPDMKSVWYQSDQDSPNAIPLYTHPVKEQDTDCQYCKQGCIRCDARKQLTDEEILELTKDSSIFEYREFDDDLVRFARAILRKAQEK
jgi:hypothetical protein